MRRSAGHLPAYLLPALAVLALVVAAALLWLLPVDPAQAQDDAVGPKITAGPTIASSPASGDTYRAGETITVTLTYGLPVTVTGKPRLRLNIGDHKRWAGYESTGADGATLFFTHVVKADDADADGISIGRNQLKLNAGTITDADGNAANLKHPPLRAQAGHQVDGAPANNEPQFADDTAARSVNENTAAGENVGDPVTAEDPDSDTLTYALTGSEAFTIDNAGQIMVASGAALDYEARASYSVTVTVHDGKDTAGEADTSEDASIAVTITVLNVDEAGAVSLLVENNTPEVGSEIGAALLDPDGGVTGETWVWERSEDGSAWTVIAGATGAAYTPTSDDVGRYLRATASYADGEGTGKTAQAATTGKVAAVIVDEPPSITQGPILNTPQSGDTYGEGEEIVVSLTFSEPVTVSGTPRIGVIVGENRRWAKYSASASGGPTLVFAYEVKGADRDDDGLRIRKNALRRNGGSIEDGGGNAASLEHAAVAASSNHKVDGSASPFSGEPQATGYSLRASPSALSEPDFTGDPKTKTVTLTLSGSNDDGDTLGFAGHGSSRGVFEKDASGDYAVATTTGLGYFTLNGGPSGLTVAKVAKPIVKSQGNGKSTTATMTLSLTGALAKPSHTVTLTVDHEVLTFGNSGGACSNSGGGGADGFDSTECPESLSATFTLARTASVPAKPTSFTATPGNQQVTLSWANPNDSSITGYHYRQKSSSGNYGSWTDIPNSGASTTSHTVSGLMNETAYTFQIRAVNATGGSESGETSATPTSKLKVSLALGRMSIAESGSNNNTTLKATLTGEAPSETVVTLSAAPLGKVQFSDNTLTIAANAVESGTVIVTAVDNDVDSLTDATVSISGAVSAVTLTAPDDATLTVIDEDNKGITVSEPRVSVNEGEMATYTVKLDSEPTAEVTVTPASDDTDAATVSEALIFTSLNWGDAQTVTVTGVQDVDDNDESVTVSHSVKGSGSGYDLETAVVAVAVDDDELDTTPPTVSKMAVTSTAGEDGTYAIDDVITATVTFSENVTVTGAPELEIQIGSNPRKAVYNTGSGSRSLTFDHAVVEGDADDDGISIGSNKLSLPTSPAAAIKDAANHAANPEHPALAASSSHKVDAVKPTATFPTSGTPTVGGAWTITLTDTNSGVKKYGAIVVDGSTGTAGDCDTADKVGTTNLTTETTALASQDFAYTTPEGSAGKKVCVYAEDAAGNSASALDARAIAPAGSTAVTPSSTGVTVPWNWPLIPSGVNPGDSFRLLFITSDSEDAVSSDIADYNSFVQAAANANNLLQPLKNHFRALISTASVDARDNTGTIHTNTDRGVPIYWLGGDKVAKDYVDFYDDSWLSIAATYEDATSLDKNSGVDPYPYTGSNANGTRHATEYAGASKVRYGSVQGANVSPLSLGNGNANDDGTFYALSPVITVLSQTTAPAVQTVSWDWPLVPSGVNPGDSFRLLFITSDWEDAVSSDIADYNSFVQAAANANNLLQPLKNHFRALISTASVDARDNTGTIHTNTDRGVPIYWLGGDKVAQDYVDFYDDSWLSIAATYEDATSLDKNSGVDPYPYTGSNANGTRHATEYAGASKVRYGSVQEANVSPLSYDKVNADDDGTFYALSPVITVRANRQPTNWSLIPKDAQGDPIFTGGESFRLLFVTSTETKARSGDIADYNALVQGRAAAVPALSAYSSQFRALASTLTVDARDNTGTAPAGSSYTAGEGAPIYWLRGDKAADHYADFYDGSWDSRAGRTETGSAYAGFVTTGSRDNGTKYQGQYAGASSNRVRSGSLTGTNESPISESWSSISATSDPLYALSPLFTVDDEAGPSVMGAPAVTSDPGADDYYAPGDAVTLEVTFDGAVLVEGVPRLTVKVGEQDRKAAYTAGGGGKTLTFSYTVGEGDADDDGVAVEANRLTLPMGAAIADAQGHAADLDHGALSDQSGHRVDGVGPAEPTGFAAVAGNGRVTLGWDDQSSDGSIKVWQYRQKKDDGEYGEWTGIAGSDKSATRHVVVGLDNGAAYTFQVRAVDRVDNVGTPSDAASAVPTSMVVASNWSLIPKDAQGAPIFTLGQKFRLLFVTSTETTPKSGDIADYNALVQGRAAAVPALSAYSGQFRALASTDAADARDNTGTAPAGSSYTAGEGVPIYWLRGDKAADHYADFYDGSWDSRAGRTETGGAYASWVFTGSQPNGTKTTNALGERHGRFQYAVGKLDAGVGKEIWSGEYRTGSESHPLYGLSPELTVGPAAPAPRVAGAPAVTSEPGADGYYAPGDAVTLEVTFDGAVLVEGAPELTVKVGTAEQTAACAAHGSQTAKLVCTYTVGEGDADDDGVAVEANRLSLPMGAAIADAQGHAANLAHEALSDQSGHRVDGVGPAKPTGLSAVAGNGRVTLGWDDQSSDGSIKVWQYRQKKDDGEYGEWTGIPGSDKATRRHVVVGLDNGAAYAFQVRAVDTDGNLGTPSDEASAVPTSMVVASNWSLIPRDDKGNPIFTLGQKFRLLFVTSTETTPKSGDIADYNALVQGRAAAVPALSAYSGQFRALASTDAADARDNTGTAPAGSSYTAGEGVPIYWLRGDKAADHYADFYDGSWDSRAGRTETGGAYASWVFTGSQPNGTKTTNALGERHGRFDYAVGKPDAGVGKEIWSGEFRRVSNSHPLYGLSPELTVGPAAPAPRVAGAPAVTSDPGADGYYVQGDAVTLEVTFDGAVLVEGVPRLTVKVGTAEQTAACAAHGSQTAKLVCTYTVGEGDADDDGVAVEANRLTLPMGASIADAQGHAANLAHEALSDQSGHRVDGVGPAKPTGFAAAAAAGNGRVELGWDDQSTDGSITGWQYRQKKDDGEYGEWTGIPGSDKSATRHVVVGLDNGAAYTFQVRAVDRVDNVGTPSDEASAVPTSMVVASNWSLIPKDAQGDPIFTLGQKFRLLFVTSTETTPKSGDIADYNALVQGRAAAVPALSAYSGQFRALASTDAADARDNTGTAPAGSSYTAGEGVPIYWLRGDKAADHYADFYDGSWDSRAGRTETGGAYASWVFTGSQPNGTKTANALGERHGRFDYAVGKLDAGVGKEIWSGEYRRVSNSHPLYGLSSELTVGPAAPAPRVAGAPAVTSDPGADGYYVQGDAVTLEVTFDGAVLVEGAPELTVKVGTAEQTAACAAHGSQTAKLVCTYTVGEGDADDDGVAVEANRLTLPPGASITGAAGSYAADLSHEALSDQSGHQVDTMPPAKPKGFAAAAGNGRVTLGWDDQSADGSITGWQHRQKKGDGEYGEWTGIPGSDKATRRHAVVGLDNAAAYTFQVRAVDRAGNRGPPSDEQIAIPISPIVATNWSLIPRDAQGDPIFTGGESFRLLFVTSTETKARSGDIADYNALVQGRAAAVPALSAYSSQFRALASTLTVDARDNTGTAPAGSSYTAGEGAPIYWLRGDKAADHYADFYDGSWDSRAGRTETGSAYAGFVTTGSRDNGTKYQGQYAGASSNRVRSGSLTGTNESPISESWSSISATSDPLYALSPLFTVDDEAGPSVMGAPAVTSDPGADDYYAPGDAVTLEVTFDGAVLVEGVPRLTVKVGEQDRKAAYTAGGGGKTLTFSYTVGEGDADDDGVAVEANRLSLPPGASIADAQGHAADLDHGALSDQSGHRVDGVGPAKPTGFAAVAGNGRVTLGWDDQSSDGSIKVWQYRQKKDDGEYGEWTGIPGSDKSATRHVVVGLDNGAAYTFQVRAVDRVDNVGTPSDEASAVPTSMVVASNWSLIPKDAQGDPIFTLGQKFRLLFVTSTETTPKSGDIADYNALVQGRAAAVPALSAYSGQFRALASTDAADARDNTGTAPAGSSYTAGEGVPIYWLRGDKAADHYADFYDGSWDSRAGRTETGGAYASWVFTGSQPNGTKTANALGERHGRFDYAVGKLDAGVGKEIWSGEYRRVSNSHPLYGLSSELTVGPAAPAPRVAGAPAVTSDPGADGYYVQGDAVTLEVTFDGAVLVEGAPELTVKVGTAEQTAACAAHGSQTAKLVCTYTVREGDADDDGVAVEANRLTLPMGAAIADAQGHAANLAHETLSDQSGHRVDGVGPAKPTGFAAVAGNGRVELGWDDQSSDASITGWEHRQKKGDGEYGEWTGIAGSDKSATRHVVVGLDNGAAYTFQVRAVDTDGNRGTPSDEASAVPASMVVASNWNLIPRDDKGDPIFTLGQKFRLLFVTTTETTPKSGDIADYNALVQGRAAAVPALSAYSSQFRALASTLTVDARDNTGTAPAGAAYTAGEGVPIYWLRGDKAADHYADFYDGSWDSRAGRTETGGAYASWVFTGSQADGTKAAPVLGSNPNYSRAGQLSAGVSKELSAGVRVGSHPLYGLSSELTVGPAAPAPRVAGAPAVTSDPGADGYYVQGDAVTLDVTFDGAVLVEGAPELTVKVGEQDRKAAYAHAVQSVPWNWPLIPSGVNPGDSFRLLFITSDIQEAVSSDIADYNSFVQAAANANNVLQPLKNHFRALISTASVDARDNTGTIHTNTDRGVPIYWLGGDKVAQDYVDFYDDSWLSIAATYEDATSLDKNSGVDPYPFTGSNANGTRHATEYAGASKVRYGSVDEANVSPLSYDKVDANDDGTFYALSPVITVRPQTTTAGSGGKTLTFSYTVREGDADEDGVAVEANRLSLPPGAAITGAASSYAADLAHEALSDQSGHRVDGVGPAKPTGFAAAAAAGNGRVELTWDDQSADGSITGWQYRQKKDDGEYGEWTGIAGSDKSATRHVVVGLDNGAAYTFQVRAVDLVDNRGTPSDEASAVPTSGVVASNWSLIPKDAQGAPIFTLGQKFRLLFVTTTETTPKSDDIADYNALVQGRAAAVPALSAYSGQFRALASTDAADARDNTGTTHTNMEQGVSIYWLRGDKAADHYADFYDGSWDSRAGRTETGGAYASWVFTGSQPNGTKTTNALGERHGRFDYAVGKPDAGVGKEIWSGEFRRVSNSHPLYGLSPELTVGPAAPAPRVAGAPAVTSDPGADGYYVQGDAVTLEVTFDGAVLVEGAPELTVKVGTAEQTAACAAHGSQTAKLVCTYTVGEGDADDDGVAVEANRLSLPMGAAIADAQGHAANLAHEALSDQSGHRVDGVGPAKPTGFAAAAGNGRVTLGWDDQSADGSIKVWQYRQKKGDGEYGEWTGIAGSDKATRRHAVVGLDNGAAYTFQVRAVDTDGNLGTPSDEASAVPTSMVVASNWSLIPKDAQGDPIFTLGQKFRLLFVTSTETTPKSGDIADYNALVQGRAAAVPALSAYSGQFRALASTDAADARDNTGTAPAGSSYTAGEGVPIYWLRGDKAADHYADFYDGSWDSRAGRTETGGAYASWVFTGSQPNGTKTTNALGERHGRFQYAVGKLDAGVGKEIWSGEYRTGSESHPLYGLSSELTVGPAAPAPRVAGAPAVTSDPGADGYYVQGDAVTLEVTFDGAVLVEGVPRLTLKVGEQDRKAAYTAGGGGKTLTFSYTVGEGDADEDGVAVEANRLTLPMGASIADAQGHAANLAHEALSDQSGHRVDGVGPAKPTGFAAAAGNGRVELTWDDQSSDGSITGWEHRQKKGDGEYGEWTGIPGSHKATTRHAVIGLDNGAAYTFQVRAVDRVDNLGTPSDAASAVPASMVVASNWPLIPKDAQGDPIFTLGQKFRLLFVTSTETTPKSGDIADYNALVQGRAAAVPALSAYSGQFRALASTDAADARDNTGTAPAGSSYTAGEGVSIYWLRGDKAADHYADFYDGSWDSRAGRTETGGAYASWVFTGSQPNGTKTTNALGERHGRFDYAVGKLDAGVGKEIWSGEYRRVSNSHPLYGLSPELTVGPAAPAPRVAGAPAVTSDPGADGYYVQGDAVTLEVTFDGAVLVEGAPELTVKVGTAEQTAACAAHGSQTAKLVCTYTVGEGDADEDGVAVEANRLTLPMGASITAGGYDAHLAHEALADQSGHQVDGVKPTIAGIKHQAPADFSGYYLVDQDLTIVVTFSEDVSVQRQPPDLSPWAPTLQVKVGEDYRTASADTDGSSTRRCASPTGPRPATRTTTASALTAAR